MIVKNTGVTFLAVLVGTFLSACGPEQQTPESDNTAEVAEGQIDRTLSASDIDPSVYFRIDDPDDPFRDVYASFRARRSSDMADPSRPPPIEHYAPAHFTREMPWDDLESVFPFDWTSVRAGNPDEARQLEDAVKARLALDHPDLKITQLMIGQGGVLPAHAEGAPGMFHVIEGSGEITVEGRTQTVTPGTTVKLNPYDIRRLSASAEGPLKLLWFRWAPNGDQRFLSAGYYLTGANQHIQPKEGVLPEDFSYWGATHTTEPVSAPSVPAVVAADGSLYATQKIVLEQARDTLGEKRNPYPAARIFSHESDIGWLDQETLENANFFWAKDVKNLGELLIRWGEVMRYKGFFQAARPDGGWDFNVSQMVWGPHARYVEHSHSIPEFYYMMSGPVEHWIEDEKHLAMPGDIFLTNSYVPHQSRGITNGVPFRNIGGSWAPNGDRSVFERPLFLLEPLPQQPGAASLADNPQFH